MTTKEIAEKLAVRLGRPCREFAVMEDCSAVMDAYQEARKRRVKEGFLPMLLGGDDVEFLQSLARKDSEEESYRKMMSQPVGDGKAVLAQIAEQHREDAQEDGFAWPDEAVVGEMAGGEAIDRFLGITDYHGKTIPMILAEIPVKNPWEVFAWLPFGGWNECPGDQEQMAVAKYWFEKYGAVPAVMTSSVLEYDLPAPVKREEAMALAMEQYAFCPDIVDQGCGTIGYLADSLAKSTKWFFWWD